MSRAQENDFSKQFRRLYTMSRVSHSDRYPDCCTVWCCVVLKRQKQETRGEKGKAEEGEQEGVIMLIHTCHWQAVSHGSQG